MMSFQFKTLAIAATLGMGLSGCMQDTGGSSVGVSQNRNVAIVNGTGRTIWRFYGSRVSTNSWEEDILGSDILPAGNTLVIDFDDGTGACLFDMMAEFRDGSRSIINDVNVCTASRVTFS